MLAYLIDTDVAIFALKRKSRGLIKHFEDNDGRMAISDVSLFELIYGAEKYEDPAKRLTIIESFIARLEVLPFEGRAAHHAAQIRANLERAGKTIGAYDLMIAGIARSRGLILATNNVREFARVDGLRVERWV